MKSAIKASATLVRVKGRLKMLPTYRQLATHWHHWLVICSVDTIRPSDRASDSRFRRQCGL